MKSQTLICPLCKKPTYIQVERNSPYDTGWGCLNCKTAVKTKAKCFVCNKSIDIYVRMGVELTKKFICEKCLKKLEKNYIPFYTKHIPSWRLHLDDATPYEILTRSYKDFGMPMMSERKWKDYYSQPHEVKKLKEFQSLRNQMRREAIRESVMNKKKEEE